PARGVAVHHVVVQQREVVHQLHRDGGGQRRAGGAADRLRGQQHQGGAERLPAVPGGGAPFGVAPAEVVSGDAVHRVGQPGRGLAQRGLDQVAGVRQDLGRGAGGGVRAGGRLGGGVDGGHGGLLRSQAAREGRVRLTG